MPSSSNASNSSFIPKRGPARRRKPKTKNQIFIFTVITYSLLFAALIAAGATFVYKNYLKSQLQQEVTTLNTAVQSFSVEDLARVREFDLTLQRATDRIAHTASVVSVLDAVDGATVQPVQIEKLTINRDKDNVFVLDGTLRTASFDAAMFQRKIYSAKRPVFSQVEVADVLIKNSVETADLGTDPTAAPEQQVTFAVSLEVPLTEVLYDPANALLLDTVDVNEAVAPDESLFGTSTVSTDLDSESNNL